MICINAGLRFMPSMFCFDDYIFFEQ